MYHGGLNCVKLFVDAECGKRGVLVELVNTDQYIVYYAKITNWKSRGFRGCFHVLKVLTHRIKQGNPGI